MRRDWLKNKRELNKLTQGELAELVGVSRIYISNIETGVRNPSPKVAKKLATLLGFKWTLFYA